MKSILKTACNVNKYLIITIICHIINFYLCLDIQDGHSLRHRNLRQGRTNFLAKFLESFGLAIVGLFDSSVIELQFKFALRSKWNFNFNDTDCIHRMCSAVGVIECHPAFNVHKTTQFLIVLAWLSFCYNLENYFNIPVDTLRIVNTTPYCFLWQSRLLCGFDILDSTRER